MYYIMAQPAVNRFKWELEVVLSNLKELGIENIILLFSRHDETIPPYLKNKYNIEVYVYDDERDYVNYIPSIRPYLWWKFLESNPHMENEIFFYLDSDVIFRERINYDNIQYSDDVWVGSNTDSYLSPSYIQSKGADLLKKMCDIVMVDYEKIKNLEGKSCGAQWLISKPTSEYWKKTYEDSNKLYQFLDSIEQDYMYKNGKSYVPIQKWTAEMWSQLWNVIYFDKDVEISNELEFCWATDDIHRWDEVKILHNAGVVNDNDGLFFKGKYVDVSPFEDDLSFVDKTKCSFKYVEAIKKVVH